MNRIEALHHEDKSLSEIELEDEKDIQSNYYLYVYYIYVDLYEDYKLLKCDYYFYALVNDIIRKGKCDYKKLENQQNLLIQSITSPFTISLKCIILIYTFIRYIKRMYCRIYIIFLKSNSLYCSNS